MADDPFIEAKLKQFRDKCDWDNPDRIPRRTAALETALDMLIEAAAGMYPASEAVEALEEAYREARDADPDPAKWYTELRERDFKKLVAGAIDQIASSRYDDAIAEKRAEHGIGEDFSELDEWLEGIGRESDDETSEPPPHRERERRDTHFEKELARERLRRRVKRTVDEEELAAQEVTSEQLDFSKAVKVPEPDALIRTDGVGLMRSNGVIHHIFGDQESGKTTVAMLTAIERLRAGETVVWLDWEMGKARLIDRMRSLGFRKAGAPFVYFYMAGTSPQAAMAQAVSHDPDWAFLDSVALALETMGGETTENAARDFLALLSILSPLIELGTSLVLIDHVGHGDKTRARGTSAKSQQVDVSFGMSVVKRWSRGSDGSAHIKVRKDRDGYFETGTLAAVAEFSGGKSALGVKLRPPSMYDEAIAAEEVRRQIIAVVTEYQPITASDVAAKVRRKKAEVLAEIKDLVEEGVLVRKGERGPLSIP